MKIKDILGRDPGYIVDNLEITVKYDFGRTASNEGIYRENDYEHPWSYQTFLAEDETGDIKIVLKNRPKEDINTGSIVKIVSKNTMAHGLNGIRLDKDNEGKDELIITKSAFVVVDNNKVTSSASSPKTDEGHNFDVSPKSMMVSFLAVILAGGEAEDVKQKHFKDSIKLMNLLEKHSKGEDVIMDIVRLLNSNKIKQGNLL